MDSSITRRGRPCWYRQPGVGTTAINDALLLEGAIYRLLRTHFKGTPYYAELLDIFHDVSPSTSVTFSIPNGLLPTGNVPNGNGTTR